MLPRTDADASTPQGGAKRDILSSLLNDAPFVPHEATELPARGGSLVGVCTDDHHPTLVGRVRVRWKTPEGEGEAWVPSLRGLAVRRGDQVLMNRPLNGPSVIVVGVIDGFAHRDPIPNELAARLELKADEVVRIDDSRGRPLIELRAEEPGPVVRLLNKNVTFEVDGKLGFHADSIHMEARKGAIEIEATDDVCVKGEVIHLN